MQEQIKFAIVVGGKAEAFITFPSHPFNDKLCTAIRDGGIFVEINENIPAGSVWDGEKFTPPQQ